MKQFGFAKVHDVARDFSNVTAPIEVAPLFPNIPVNSDEVAGLQPMAGIPKPKQHMVGIGICPIEIVYGNPLTIMRCAMWPIATRMIRKTAMPCND